MEETTIGEREIAAPVRGSRLRGKEAVLPTDWEDCSMNSNPHFLGYPGLEEKDGRSMKVTKAISPVAVVPPERLRDFRGTAMGIRLVAGILKHQMEKLSKNIVDLFFVLQHRPMR